MKRRVDDRGAAAVEFALVLPVLLTLAVGIAEFGHAYSVQTTLSNAAREGVRVMALNNNAAAARTAARTAAGSIALNDSNISVSPTTCISTASANASATVTITYTMPFATRLFGQSITLHGKGVMRCGG